MIGTVRGTDAHGDDESRIHRKFMGEWYVPPRNLPMKDGIYVNKFQQVRRAARNWTHRWQGWLSDADR